MDEDKTRHYRNGQITFDMSPLPSKTFEWITQIYVDEEKEQEEEKQEEEDEEDEIQKR